MKRIGMIAAAAAFLMTAVNAAAHHSFAMFDKEKTYTVDGTVTKFQFTNPHVWIWIEVPEGEDQPAGLYGFESGSPSQLMRMGIPRSSFKPGDRITVRFHPLRDGRKGGQFLGAVLASGRVLDMRSEVDRFANGIRD